MDQNDQQKYLNYDGLAYYDTRMKNLIHTEDNKRVNKRDVITNETIDKIIAGIL